MIGETPKTHSANNGNADLSPTTPLPTLNPDMDGGKRDFDSVLSGNSSNDDTGERLEESSKNSQAQKDSDAKKTENKSVLEKPQNVDNLDELDSPLDKSVGDIKSRSPIDSEIIKFPNPRSIMHVGDLERIISAIRSQNVAAGKQVSIDLKRSILNGLQVNLTIGADKKVSAEFIAANENVRSQLNARAEELSGLLRDRGVNLTEVKMSLSSEQDDKNERQPSSEKSQATINSSTKTSDSLPEEHQNSVKDSNTSYQV